MYTLVVIILKLKYTNNILFGKEFNINSSKRSINNYKNTHKCSLASINYLII